MSVVSTVCLQGSFHEVVLFRVFQSEASMEVVTTIAMKGSEIQIGTFTSKTPE